MALVKYDPFRGLDSLTRKMNSFFDSFDDNVRGSGFVPTIDISEDDKFLYIHAELPGVKKEDIKLSVNDDNILTIKGEKNRDEKTEEEKDGISYIRIERGYGSFQRSFVLPEDVKKDDINANYKDGVLDLKIEKTEPPKPKEIEISVD